MQCVTILFFCVGCCDDDVGPRSAVRMAVTGIALTFIGELPYFELKAFFFLLFPFFSFLGKRDASDTSILYRAAEKE